MAQSRVTLRDIADKIGVHPSTVSRVLNPKTRQMVTEEIADKVLSAAEEMGYRPNLFALSLKTNRSFTVGVMVPDLTNPAFAPIIKGIDNVLEQSGYNVIVANTDNLIDKQQRSVEKFRERHVDGLIIATAQRKDSVIDECCAEGTPFVLAVRASTDIGVSSVVSDENVGANMVISHLAQLGHTEIAHVAGPQFYSTGFERHQGFLQGMQNAGLNPDPELIAFCDAFTEEEGRRATSKLLAMRKKFTAIFAANDMLALGVYDELEADGIRCGTDISVVGFDDMPFADKFNPPLTTVHTPLIDVGAEAARILLEQIDNPDIPARTIKLKPDLIVRKSSGPVE
ncbi:MAG: LacI family DNA-binding transcriptional regulator [Rhodospirillales bacterium]|nr:LacI family DNA-binding transcriptional regulator [Rhodospirillales bacterium]